MNKPHDMKTARMHLECINEAMIELQDALTLHSEEMDGKMPVVGRLLSEISDRLWASMYILQKEDDGILPTNYEFVVGKGDMWDVDIDGEVH